VHLYVDDWLDVGHTSVVQGQPEFDTLRVGRVYGGLGLVGCVDEVFVLSATAERSELLALSTFHRTLVTPSVGGAGYALQFSRLPGAVAGSGGYVEVAGPGPARVLGYSGSPGEAMTLAFWLRPEDPNTLAYPGDGLRVAAFVVVDKSVGSVGQPCHVPEYRVSLEAIPDRSGATSRLHYEVRVDLGAVPTSDGLGVKWADEWPTGVHVPFASRPWTYLTITWTSTTIQVYTNGVLAVSVVPISRNPHVMQVPLRLSLPTIIVSTLVCRLAQGIIHSPSVGPPLFPPPPVLPSFVWPGCPRA
jgi:hypothetical protein